MILVELKNKTDSVDRVESHVILVELIEQD